MVSPTLCVVCCGSLQFVVSTRQIKEKWLHVHIDFCPQFAGGYGGWSLRERAPIFISLSPSHCLSFSVFLTPFPLSFTPYVLLCTTIQFDLLPPFPLSSSFTATLFHPVSLSLPFRGYPPTLLSNSLLFPFSLHWVRFQKSSYFSNFTTILHIEIFPREPETHCGLFSISFSFS